MKRILSAVLAVLLICSMAGCKKEKQQPQKEPAAAQTQQENFGEKNSEDNTAGYPVTVIDQSGRYVVLEREPQRVVSGSAGATKALLAMGQIDKLVGIEANAQYDPFYEKVAPKVLRLPGMGEGKFDLNKCLAAEPDLVILPVEMAEAVEILEEKEVQVLLVDPQSIVLVDEMTDKLGAALNCLDAASELTGHMDDVVYTVDQAVLGSEMPTVYMAGTTSVLMAAGTRMHAGHLINYAGGTNAAEQVKNHFWTQVTYEQLQEWNPSYIVIASDAIYTVEEVLADPELAKVDAVKNGRVYQMPSEPQGWDELAPVSVLGAMWLSSVIHPDLITEQMVSETAAEFYRTLYNYNMEQ